MKNVKQYNNVEQFQQARNSQSLNPMEERKAQQQFQQQEKLRREHMMQKFMIDIIALIISLLKKSANEIRIKFERY